MTDFDTLAIPWKILQTPRVIAILYEAYNHYRQILLDGRPLPTPTQPAYMGYSVGKWEGDTLVVDSTAKPWGGSLVLNYVPDEELIESICENEKDVRHMVGK